MKSRLLNQIFLLLAILVSQIGFAGDHPISNAQFTTNPTGCKKQDQCFDFHYKGHEISKDRKTVVLTFSIKTNCKYDLSHVAFELPAGCSAKATGYTKYKYKTELTNNPFRSIKFETVGWRGCRDGDEEVFKYILTKMDFDKLKTIRIQAKAGKLVGSVSFDKDCDIPKCVVSPVALTNVKYTVDGKTSADMQAVAKPGKPVKVCFTVPASSGYKTYSLVSYKAPSGTFIREEAELQELFNSESVTVGPKGGTYCLYVKVPDCYYQVDFVKGCVIEKLGPPNSNNYYGDQGRLIATATGGTFACSTQCVNTGTVTNVKYLINNQVFTSLKGNVKPGVPVKVCFDIPAGTGYRTYSLVSYTAPYPVYSEQEAASQKVFSYKTITIGSTTAVTNVCLEVKVPDCYFQVDFVKGCIIEKLGPAGSTNFYAKQNRLIAFDNGGTVACVPEKPLGNEGCSPEYWKQKQSFSNWPVSTTTKFFEVFSIKGVDDKYCSFHGVSPNLTLLEALCLKGGGFKALVRHAAAAYLNAKSPKVKYSFKVEDVLSGVVKAFNYKHESDYDNNDWDDDDDKDDFIDKLKKANKKGCPCGNDYKRSSIAVSDRSAQLQTEQSIVASAGAYPNPFSNKAAVRFSLKKAGKYTVSLYTANGKQVRQLKNATGNAGELVQIDVDGGSLPAGLYLVKFVANNETQTLKLVLKR
jgi:hypothetical protein